MESVACSGLVFVLPLSLILNVGCLVLNPNFDSSTTGQGASGAPSGTTDEPTDGVTDGTGEPTGGDTSGTAQDSTPSPCPVCEATKTACEESVPCQAITSLADQCPGGDLTCIKQMGCAILTPPAASEGFGLWSTWISCVAHECLGAPYKCLEEHKLCIETKDCVEIDVCVKDQCTCLDDSDVLACWNACANEHPGGRELWNAWYSCLNSTNSA